MATARLVEFKSNKQHLQLVLCILYVVGVIDKQAPG
jgi:hypothetical protein